MTLKDICKTFQSSKDSKPYQTSCFSLYFEDRERIRRVYKSLKEKGIKNVTVSSIIRFLIEDLAKRIDAGENITFPEKLR